MFLVTIEYSGSHYSGWSVSHSLEDHNESIIMTNTTKEFELCPKGLEQGYFFYQQLDVTFSINCHEDQIKDDCDDCQVVNVNSSGALSKLYSITMGDFMRQGSFNGYPLFAKQDVLEYEGQPSFNLTSYLYFRKQGNYISVLLNPHFKWSKDSRSLK